MCVPLEERSIVTLPCVCVNMDLYHRLKVGHTKVRVITVGLGIYTVPSVLVPSAASLVRILNSVMSNPFNLFRPATLH